MTKQWTEARLKSFIISALRGAFRKYPVKSEVLKEASVGKRLNSKTNRIGEHYICNSCKKIYPAKEVNVDHILPCVPPETGFTTWDSFIDRLFCDRDNLQVLCKECHDEKTAMERKERVK